ncbi:hypothetical protein [Massilia sp. CCM 8734]|uniref:hypothetical protein n=1 Tax=Massilia sp. CCM 8734 TaxID=2609283 RepID=UPI00141EC921|nr:hypothetical protein [Massilia sp. CCM 8734]NHZ94578.1 hypothetical protein [Massilia sp. CCM 8734]
MNSTYEELQIEAEALRAEVIALRALVNVKPAKRNDYPDEFEEVWAAYPARSGANKVSSFKAWGTRVKAGTKPADILAGVKRYAEYVKSERTEDRYIKQPATFFGPDEHFLLPWASKRGGAGRQSLNEEAKRRLFGGYDEFGGLDAPR